MSKRSQRIARLAAQQDPQDRIVLPDPPPAPASLVWEPPPHGFATVYLAGKITRNCWRHSLFPLGDASEKGPPLYRDGFAYGGPYFISCGHGCSHGRGEHG